MKISGDPNRPIMPADTHNPCFQHPQTRSRRTPSLHLGKPKGCEKSGLARSADNENPLTAIAGGFRVGAPGVVEQRGIGGVSKGERLRAILVAYRPEPDDWTRSGHPVMRLAARREPQHPKVGVRPVFDAARRASVSVLSDARRPDAI